MIAAVGQRRRAVWRSLLPHIREELRSKTLLFVYLYFGICVFVYLYLRICAVRVLYKGGTANKTQFYIMELKSWHIALFLNAFLQHIIALKIFQNCSGFLWLWKGSIVNLVKFNIFFLQGTVILKLLYCMPGCTKSILAVFVYLSIFVFVHLCID